MQKSPKAMLVALTDGSAPHTDPLDCDDMRGPRSFFGESAIMPRPIADLPGCCEDLTDAALVAAYGGACSLWHCHDGLSDAERARRIRSARLQCSLPLHETDEPRARKLDVPARTYLAGRSSSSFAVAWKLYQDGLLPEWGAVLCSCQTEGRGRLRRHWHSPRGNLHVTFRLPADPLFQGDAASLLIGMLLLRAFRALGFPLSLKWPNDLLLEERLKVGGILLEERGGVVLAGLGVNLVEAPEALRLREGSALLAGLLLPQAESAPGGDDADEPLAPFPLWRRLVSEAILEYEERMAGHEASELLADLGWLMAWKQRRVFLFEEGSDPVQGLFLGPGPSGGALLRLADREQEFFSGSLSLHS